MLYNLFLFFHIFCAGMVLSNIPFSILMDKRRARSKGTVVELHTIAFQFGVAKFMGMVGGLGLLVAGVGMTIVAQMPWFAFNDPNFRWLAVKQTLYIIILAINFGLMIPTSKQMMPLVAQELSKGGASGATEEIEALASKTKALGMVMGLLALISGLYGVFGPSWRFSL